MLNHSPKGIKNNLGYYPYLRTFQSHIVGMPRTLIFHSKGQWHVWIQGFHGITWLLRQIEFLLEILVFVDKPPHISMFYALFCHLLPHLFVQVMVFCNINYANLIKIEVKLAHTLLLFIGILATLGHGMALSSTYKRNWHL